MEMDEARKEQHRVSGRGIAAEGKRPETKGEFIWEGWAQEIFKRNGATGEPTVKAAIALDDKRLAAIESRNREITIYVRSLLTDPSVTLSMLNDLVHDRYPETESTVFIPRHKNFSLVRLGATQQVAVRHSFPSA
jgi:hypothetical protein